MEIYLPNQFAAFRRNKDEFGDLSNMANGMPITVDQLTFQSSEGLYQALKFPSMPNVQQQIAKANNGFNAKKTAYAWKGIRTDWNDVRIDAMRIALYWKLCQNYTRFYGCLLSTNGMPIVEISLKDSFWGAAPKPNGTLVGENILGKLLIELRDAISIHNGKILFDHRFYPTRNDMLIQGRRL